MSKSNEEIGVWAIKGEPAGSVPKLRHHYRVIDSRKGTFTAEVLEVNGVWATVRITDGYADAILEYNIRSIGDEISIRDSLCRLEEIPAVKEPA